MVRNWIVMITVVALASAAAPGQQNADDEQAADTPAKSEVAPGKFFSPFPVPKYGGDLRERSAMSGDWGGLRSRLAEDGISFKLEATQIWQHNAHGGASTKNGTRYGGSVDYTIKLDTGRMGLWPGGQWTIHAETQFGSSVNFSKTGAIMAPNFDALMPTPDEGRTTLSEVFLTQPLSEKFVVILGKADGTRFADKNAFANSEKTQFMNAAFKANPVVFPFAPYTALGAFFVWLPEEWITIGGGLMNTNDSATITGFNTGFHSPEGWTASVEIDFNIHPFGLTGHQRFGYVYSTKDYNVLGGGDRVNIPGRPVANLLGAIGAIRNPDTRPDDWAFYYNFDQYLYTEKEDPKQGIGVFGRFGWSTGESNPIAAFYSLGIGGQGIIPNRDNDTFGLGYYYVDMSDNLPSFLNITSEQGAELYYNIEITPWMHITPDLQVIIDPGGNDNDVAVIYGLRMQMTF